MAVGIHDTPVHDRIRERAGTEINRFHRRFQRIRRGEYPLPQTDEGNDRVAIFFEFHRRHIAFALPERIQQTDQRGALAGVIVQVEQLKSGQLRRAQVGLNFLLIARGLEMTRGLRELMVLRQHAMGDGGVAENFIIPGLHEPREFPDDIKIRIRHPLAEFMRHHRHADAVQGAAVVATEPASLAARASGAHPAADQIIRPAIQGLPRRINGQPARIRRVQMARVSGAIMLHPQRQHFFPMSRRFVARRNQQQRGMVAVILDDAIGFTIEHLFDGAADGKTVPHAALDLQVKTQFIRRCKRRFRRTPRMKAHMIQPPILARLKNLLPGCHIRGRISRERKISAKMGAAQINGVTVQHEFMRPGANIAQTKYGGGVIPVFQSCDHPVQRGMKFIPQPGIRREGDFRFKGAGGRIPTHGNLRRGNNLG